MRVAVSLLLLSHQRPVAALDNGVGLTPPMGFNSWNQLGCDFNETRIMRIADAMHDGGFVAAGYVYLTLDDCWMDRQRDEEGNWQMDTRRFPSGPHALVRYLNARGLRLGLYSSAGPKTCQGLPASLGRERQDAATIASWGVDFLKYDNCGSEGVAQEEQARRHRAMRDALNATGRPIFFSLSEWNGHRGDPFAWVRETANSWRTNGDIDPHWQSVMYEADHADRGDDGSELAGYAGPGGWNDPDMLEVGVYVASEKPQFLTDVEARSHFALWCLLKAPLMLGGDPGNMTAAAAAAALSRGAIAVNQDPLGAQGRKLTAAERAGAAADEQTQRRAPAPAGGGVAAGDYAATVPCAAAPAVRWNRTGAGAATLSVDAPAGGALCLTLTADAVPSSGRPRVEWWPCGAAGNLSAQGFANRTADAYVVHRATGQCLEIAWEHAYAGADVEVNPCGEGRSERWRAQPATGRVVAGTNASNCLGARRAAPPPPPPPPAPRPPAPAPAGEVWAGPLAGGDVACLLLNREPVGAGEGVAGGSGVRVTCPFSAVKLGASRARVVDVFSGKTLGEFEGGYSAVLEAHGSGFVRLTPV